MRKLILISAAILLFSLASPAQTYVNLGAGRISNVIQSKGTETVERPSSALIVGASHNFTFFENFGLEAGLNYVYGFYNRSVEKDESSIVKCRYHGLNLPVELNYKFDLGSNVYLGLFAGPVLSYGFSDKEKTTKGDKITSTVDYFANDTHKRFRTAAELAISAEFARCIRMKFGGQIGLVDIDKTSTVHKQHMYTFSISYAF